jgi:hypothetical protein
LPVKPVTAAWIETEEENNFLKAEIEELLRDQEEREEMRYFEDTNTYTSSVLAQSMQNTRKSKLADQGALRKPCATDTDVPSCAPPLGWRARAGRS